MRIYQCSISSCRGICPNQITLIVTELPILPITNDLELEIILTNVLLEIVTSAFRERPSAYANETFTAFPSVEEYKALFLIYIELQENALVKLKRRVAEKSSEDIFIEEFTNAMCLIVEPSCVTFKRFLVFGISKLQLSKIK